MAPIAQPLIQIGESTAPSRSHGVKVVAVLFAVLGLGCTMWALNKDNTATDSATDMAFAPMQQPKVRQPMQALRTPAFRQPVQAQASKSPLAGLLDIVIPGKNPSEEIDILMPVTKREMLAAAAAGAAATMTAGSAFADVDPALKKKLCASNPTSKACLTNSGKN
eukprot:gnl/MRDRNA2_/MRDRNA2_81951_c0_seq1.p1 gnl/MRDRNA2_/MRDRNA2_81951_c0~~gnl/MRDRNA2_/MRDRNA2_81951_c0_seq1.p1  ORF type:complete len:165 (-),score=43.75 gnl/MRDRNA2_/MRDRNA2_81951_c0_seq1:536-1030(-)